jgi:hypothetical protein
MTIEHNDLAMLGHRILPDTTEHGQSECRRVGRPIARHRRRPSVIRPLGPADVVGMGRVDS